MQPLVISSSLMGDSQSWMLPVGVVHTAPWRAAVLFGSGLAPASPFLLPHPERLPLSTSCQQICHLEGRRTLRSAFLPALPYLVTWILCRSAVGLGSAPLAPGCGLLLTIRTLKHLQDPPPSPHPQGQPGPLGCSWGGLCHPRCALTFLYRSHRR